MSIRTIALSTLSSLALSISVSGVWSAAPTDADSADKECSSAQTGTGVIDNYGTTTSSWLIALAHGMCGDEGVQQAVDFANMAVHLDNFQPALDVSAVLMRASGDSQKLRLAGSLLEYTAQKGNPQAQHQFGLFLLWYSNDGNQSAEGLTWLGAAAGRGHALSAASLATIYGRGMHDVGQDRCLASMYSQAAIELGFPKEALSELAQRNTCGLAYSGD